MVHPPAMPLPRFILALPLLLAALPLGTTSDMVTYKLQHAFGLTAAFQDRGSIDVLVDSGALTLIPPAEDQTVLVPEESLDEIAREMRQPDGGLYRLRAQRSDASAPVIMTSVHLCDVVRAGFRENITLTLDVDGRLLGLEYTPRMSRLSPTTCLAMKSPLDEVNRNSDGTRKDVVADKGPSAFSTFIKAAVDQAGQSLPVVVPGQRPPMIQIRYDEQERKPEVEKSFLQKYWIFIVLAFLILNSGAAPPEEEGGAGGGAGGEGPRLQRGHGQGVPRGGGGQKRD